MVKLLVIAAALGLSILVVALMIAKDDQDFCLMGKGLIPCSMTPDFIEIKVHDDQEDSP
jgi:hypothetical protein